MSSRPWFCPVDGCTFETCNPRARAPHLLRVHHLLFQSHGRPPIPLSAEPLAERLDALRRRRHGSRQRRRDAARAASAGVGGTSPVQPQRGPVTGSPTAAPVSNSSTEPFSVSAVSVGDDEWGATPYASATSYDSDEDWANSVIDVLQLDGEDWDRELGFVPLPAERSSGWEVVPWIAPDGERPELPEIPGGLTPAQLVQMVLSSEAGPETSLRDVFVVDEEERQRLLLFGEVAVTAGRFVASSALSNLTTDCRLDPSGVTGLQRLLGLLMWLSSPRANPSKNA